MSRHRLVSAVAAWLVGCGTPSTHSFIEPVELSSHAWLELYRDSLYAVSLDTANVTHGPEPNSYAVWYHTDRFELQAEDGEPWNREVIRSLLRCAPLQFKTVRITVFLDAGAPVAQQGGTMEDAGFLPWRDVAAESVDERSLRAACVTISEP